MTTSTTIRRYVLVLRDLSRPDPDRDRLELMQAYDAADAIAQWRCRSFGYDMEKQQLVPREHIEACGPFDETLKEHRDAAEIQEITRRR